MADYKDIKYNVDYSETSGAGGLIKITSNHQATTDSDDGAAAMDFTTGIDSTYDVYMFQLQGCIPVGTNALQFQVDTGTNTNYNITNTSVRNSFFHANDNSQVGHSGHEGSNDSDTNFCTIGTPQKGSSFNRGAVSGYVILYNPSSTVFEKHWLAKISGAGAAGSAHFVEDYETAGYFQTTTALTRVRFKYNTNDFIGGRITMFGLVK